MNQFNMDQIGRKISNLRREQNMTQMELADKLGISFQAVSNWERGTTMPDISKLPELAEIFHVTTDELLGEASGGLVRSAAKGEMEQYMEVNSVTVEEFVQVASLLSTVQAEAGFEKLTEQKTQLKLSDIEDILPFLGSDMVDELALKYMDSPEGDDLEDIARYASGPVLKQIAEKLVAEGKNIEDIARYLSTEDVDRAVLSYMETANWGYLEDIARYASGSVMEQAAEKLVAEGKNIEDIARFLSGECVNRLARSYIEAANWGHLEDIARFLSSDVLEEIADRLAGTGQYGKLEDFLRFLAPETVDRLARKAYEEKGLGTVEDFMKFLSQETRQEIARKEYGKNGLRNMEDIARFLDKEFLTGLAKETLEKEGIKGISPIARYLDQEMLIQFVREKYL